MNHAGKMFGMKINVKKTKIMKFTRHEDDTITKIKIDNEEIENVTEFGYCGALINIDGTT